MQRSGTKDAENGILMPVMLISFGLLGIATIAYEIAEQMNSAPGTVIAPVGHGGLLLGTIMGFQALLKSDVMGAMPYFLGVQAKMCDPIVRKLEGNERTFQGSGKSSC